MCNLQKMMFFSQPQSIVEQYLRKTVLKAAAVDSYLSYVNLIWLTRAVEMLSPCSCQQFSWMFEITF